MPLETHSGWRPLAETSTVSSLCMRCLCHPRVMGTRPAMLRDPSFPTVALHPCISGDAARPREVVARVEATEGGRGCLGA